MKRNNSIELFPHFAAWTHTSVSKFFEQTSNHHFFLFVFLSPISACIILSTEYVCVRGIICLSCNCLFWIWLGFLEKFQVEFASTKTELNAKLWVLEAKMTDMIRTWLSLKHLFKLSAHQMLEFLQIISPELPCSQPLGRTQSIVSAQSSTASFSPPSSSHASVFPCAVHARSTTGPLASVDIGSNCCLNLSHLGQLIPQRVNP